MEKISDQEPISSLLKTQLKAQSNPFESLTPQEKGLIAQFIIQLKGDVKNLDALKSEHAPTENAEADIRELLEYFEEMLEKGGVAQDEIPSILSQIQQEAGYESGSSGSVSSEVKMILDQINHVGLTQQLQQVKGQINALLTDIEHQQSIYASQTDYGQKFGAWSAIRNDLASIRGLSDSVLSLIQNFINANKAKIENLFPGKTLNFNEIIHTLLGIQTLPTKLPKLPAKPIDKSQIKGLITNQVAQLKQTLENKQAALAQTEKNFQNILTEQQAQHAPQSVIAQTEANRTLAIDSLTKSFAQNIATLLNAFEEQLKNPLYGLSSKQIDNEITYIKQQAGYTPTPPPQTIPEEAKEILNNPALKQAIDTSVQAIEEKIQSALKTFNQELASYKNATWPQTKTIYQNLLLQIELIQQGKNSIQQGIEGVLNQNASTLQSLKISPEDISNIASYFYSNSYESQLPSTPKLPSKPVGPTAPSVEKQVNAFYESHPTFSTAVEQAALKEYQEALTKYDQDYQTFETSKTQENWLTLESDFQQLSQAKSQIGSKILLFLKSEQSLLEQGGVTADLTKVANYIYTNKLSIQEAKALPQSPTGQSAFPTPPNWNNPQDFPYSSVKDSKLVGLMKELSSGINPQTGKPLTSDEIIQLRNEIFTESQNIYSIPDDGQDMTGKYLPPAPPPSGGPGSPSNLHWLPTQDGYVPTNDWAEDFALKDKGNSPVGLGPYNGYMTSDGVQYRMPSAFTAHTGPDGQHFILETMDGPEFTIGSDHNYGDYVMWAEGSGMRVIRHGPAGGPNYIEYISPDQLLASTQYNNADVFLQIAGTPTGPITPQTITENGQTMYKYLIHTDKGTYVFYTKTDCALSYDASKGGLVSSAPYSGFIQGGALPINPSAPPTQEQLQAAEDLMDQDAGVVITKMDLPFVGSGSAINTVTETLDGKPSSGKPVLLLNYMQQESLAKGSETTGVTYQTLTGPVRAVIGGTVLFSHSNQLPKTSSLVNTDPSKYSSEELDQLAEQFAATKGDKDILNYLSPSEIYGAGKLMQRLVSRLQIGELLLKAQQQGHTFNPPFTDPTLAELVKNKYDDLVKCIKEVAHNLTINHFGVVVSNMPAGDYGDNSYSNDRIIHMGYLMNAIAGAIEYENSVQMPSSERFENQQSGIGSVNYTYGQLARVYLNNVLNPQHPRQWSAVDGHSWLSGLEGYNDGMNTESDSEALNGDLGAYRLAQAFAEATVTSDPEESAQWSNYAQYAQTLSATEAQGIRDLWQVDGSKPGLYVKGFGDDSECMSATNIFTDKVDSNTLWGSNWATRIAIGLMPVNEEQMNLLLYDSQGQPSQWTKDAATFIMNHFNPNDPQGGAAPYPTFLPYMAVIVAAAGKTSQAEEIYNWCNQHNQFDSGIDALNLKQLLMYAAQKNQAS